MNRFYLAITLVVLFLLILSLTRLRLRLRYLRRGKDDEVALEISLWQGLVSYKLEVPVIEVTGKKKKKLSRSWLRRPSGLVPRPVFKIKTRLEEEGGRPILKDKRKVVLPGPARIIRILQDVGHMFKKYYPALRYLLGKTHLRRFRWRTELGTGDAALTGILTGAVWGLKGTLLSFAYRLLHRGGARPEVAVAPSFNKTCFNMALDCVFEIRIGHLLFTGVKALVLKFK